jgi:hypothetical protein
MSKCFYEKVTDHNYIYNGNTIAAGTKIIKAFKYFEEDKEVLHRLQDAASRLIQEDMVEGIMCLSVHPLDFLSLSENASKWRSCHALDGDYCAGNLSYMCDKTTVITYIKSENDEIINNFPFSWNNKKWRMLLFFSNDGNMMAAGRQYPFASTSALEFVKEVLIRDSNIVPYYWGPWQNYCLESVPMNENERFYFDSSYIIMGTQLVSKYDVFENQSNLHFNDLIYSSCYKVHYAFAAGYESTWRRKDPMFFGWDDEVIPNETKFSIGNMVKCLCCGEDYIFSSDSVMCDSCITESNSKHEIEESNGDYYYCDYCDRRYNLEDGVVDLDEGIFVCGHCYEEYFDICEKCKKIIPKDQMVYDRDSGLMICWNCNNHIESGGLPF